MWAPPIWPTTGLTTVPAMAGPIARGLTRGILARIAAANVIAGLLVAAYIEMSEPAREGVSLPLRLVGSLGSTTALAIVLVIVGYRRALRDFQPALSWLDDGRVPTAEDRDNVLSQPWRATRRLFGYWTVASGVVSMIFLVTDMDLRTAGMGLSATLLGGLTASAMTFFLAERLLRPVVAQALGGTSHLRPDVPGVRQRLLVAWTLGSGVPLLGLVLTPLLRDPDADVSLAVVTTFLASGGLIAGLVTTRMATRSVAEPLAEVRRGLRRVQQGDLEALVSVDDGGEIGLLEAGFNDMVEGLRERRRLEDLFGRHVGADVARQAIERGVALGGEVREASVLFVDLTGSTAYAATRSPQDVLALLNQFFQAVVQATDGESGWVNKFEGDAALCVFGAPVPQADHAARALRAARRLDRELEDLRRRYPELDAGIGVSAGDVVAGNVGAERRFEYTVIGDPVNEASRLTDEAKRGSRRVLASGAAIERAGDEADNWTCVAKIQLRGRPTETTVYGPA